MAMTNPGGPEDARLLSSDATQLSIVQRRDGALSVAALVTLPEAFRQRYRLDRQLGAGAMGAVWLAVDLRHDRPVAIKFLVGTGERELIERFRREGRLLASVRHPAVLEVIDIDEVDDQPFLVTEYLSAGSLRGRIKPAGLPLPQVIGWAVDCLDGLQACHDAGVLHRDIKPDNILFGADERPRLADLGLAVHFQETESLTRTGSLLGTPRYLAPECIRGLPAGVPTDLYAMGTTIYEALAGRPPFVEGSVGRQLIAHLQQAPPPLDELVRVPRALAACLERALAKEPDARPPSARAFAGELSAALKSGERRRSAPVATPARARAPEPARAPALRDPRGWSGRSRVVAAVLVLALAGAASMLGLRARDRRGAELDRQFDERIHVVYGRDGIPAAVNVAREWVAARPDLAEAHGQLGALLQHSGHPEEAEAELRIALASRSDAATMARLALTLSERGRIPEAEQLIDQAIRLRPDDSYALEVLATFRRTQGRIDEACALLERSALATTGDMGPYWWLARIHLENGRPEAAERWTREGLERFPAAVELLPFRERALRALGRWREGVACLRQYLKARPGSTDEAWSLAVGLAEHGEPAPFAELDPNLTEGQRRALPGMLVCVARLRTGMTTHERLQPLIEEARRRDPTGPYTRAAVALVSFQPEKGESTASYRERRLQAARSIDEAHREAPGWLLAVAAGYAYDLADRPREAEPLLIEATKTHDGRPGPHLCYSEFLMRTRRAEQAAEQLRAAVACDRSNSALLGSLESMKALLQAR